MRNSTLCFSLTILCLTLFCTGCNLFPRLEKETPPEEAPAQLTIVYAEESFLYLPLYVACHQGFFQDENLIINLQKINSQEIISGLRTGEYDLVLGGAEKAFYSYQQDEKDKLLMLGQIAIKTGHFLLAQEYKQPFAWQETKGKVIISTASGDIGTITLEHLLRKHNLSPFLDVHLIKNLSPPLRKGAFLSGTAQYILTTEPTATFLEKKEAGQVIISLDEQLQVNIPTVIITSQNRLKENQKTNQKFIKALEQGLTWLNEHSPEEITLVAQKFFPEHQEKTLLRGICRYKNLGCWPKTSTLSEKGLLTFQQILLETQELNSPLPLYKLITP